MRTTLSLAGRTKHPVLPPVPCRIGGFGGAEGLALWMREQGVTALVDATHPFARRMPFNAEAATRMCGVPLLSLLRPAWEKRAGDDWREVATHGDAIDALGLKRKTVFLTVGRLEMEPYHAAPQHRYIVRSVDPVEKRTLPDAVWLTGRGPFSLEDETALMAEHGVEALVTKNSGGSATEAKITVARNRHIPILLLARPPRPAAERVATAEEAMEWIARVHGVIS